MKPRQAQPRQCSVLATKLLNGGHFRSGPPLVLHMALSLMKLQAAWHSAEMTGDAMLHQPARHGNLGERCILAAAFPPTHRFVGESNGTDWSSICRGSAVRGFGQAQQWRIANKLLQHGRLAAGAAAFDFTCLPGLCCIFALTFPWCNGNALPFMNEINYKVLTVLPVHARAHFFTVIPPLLKAGHINKVFNLQNFIFTQHVALFCFAVFSFAFFTMCGSSPFWRWSKARPVPCSLCNPANIRCRWVTALRSPWLLYTNVIQCTS